MRLVDAVRAVIANAGKSGGEKTQAGSFFDKGEITNLSGVGDITVTVKGKMVSAKPLTDEPFKKGQMVWVSQSSDGYVIHGGVR